MNHQLLLPLLLPVAEGARTELIHQQNHTLHPWSSLRLPGLRQMSAWTQLPTADGRVQCLVTCFSWTRNTFSVLQIFACILIQAWSICDCSIWFWGGLHGPRQGGNNVAITPYVILSLGQGRKAENRPLHHSTGSPHRLMSLAETEYVPACVWGSAYKFVIYLFIYIYIYTYTHIYTLKNKQKKQTKKKQFNANR